MGVSVLCSWLQSLITINMAEVLDCHRNAALKYIYEE